MKQNNKKVIYLGAKADRYPYENIYYNDIINYDGINYCCDMRQVDLSEFDILIATPPCNYYSRANYRRNESEIALETKDLLPWCLQSFHKIGKPYLVENVMNKTLLPIAPDFYFYYGNHTFFTNILFGIPSQSLIIPQHTQERYYNHRDGNRNVHIVIDTFLQVNLFD